MVRSVNYRLAFAALVLTLVILMDTYYMVSTYSSCIVVLWNHIEAHCWITSKNISGEVEPPVVQVDEDQEVHGGFGRRRARRDKQRVKGGDKTTLTSNTSRLRAGDSTSKYSG